MARKRKLLFFATEDWYFVAHRLGLACAAIDAGYEVAVATRVNKHARAIGDAGVKLLTLNWHRGSLNPLRLQGEVREIRDFINDELPDIVHCVSLRTIVATCMALHGLPRQRAVMAFTGLGYLFVGNQLWKRLARKFVGAAIKGAAREHHIVLLFENADDRDTILKLVKVDVETEVNPGSGVNTDRFTTLPPPDNPVPVFAFAGRILRIKGIEELVRASLQLDARGLEHEVLLAGPLDEQNRSGISKIQLDTLLRDSPVRWIGEVGDVRALWARVDVAVGPSHGGEGVPLALVEAAACARPLIGSDVPGCRDIVRNAETGLLVPPRDVKALAEAMTILARNASVREMYGKKAAEVARNEFSQGEVTSRTFALYDRLMEKSAGG
ncbi:glycosyltransferase family 4 protein [Tepidamorphus sp. 3E244]|uniref:glycosyltransferase family 4 protein n=1 Tax=Tepidamorphus sp. 3E244 TaxID=3385498 RepID=UPI0038FC71D1